MEMNNEEICRSYQQAKYKAKQIQILADMNICSEAEIIAVLQENDIPVGVRAKKTLGEETDYQPVFKKAPARKKPVLPAESSISWQDNLKAITEHIAELKQQEEAIKAELAEIYQALGELCGRE